MPPSSQPAVRLDGCAGAYPTLAWSYNGFEADPPDAGRSGTRIVRERSTSIQYQFPSSPITPIKSRPVLLRTAGACVDTDRIKSPCDLPARMGCSAGVNPASPRSAPIGGKLFDTCAGCGITIARIAAATAPEAHNQA